MGEAILGATPEGASVYAARVASALGRPHDAERSAKVGRNGVLFDRVLLSYRVDRLSQLAGDSVDQLVDLGGLPDEFRSRLACDLGDADWFHLGYERGQSDTTIKVYLEFQEPLRQRSRGGQSGLVLVHRAYKAALSSGWSGVGTYWCDPTVDGGVLHSVILSSFPKSERGLAVAATDLLAAARARSSGPLMALQVSEEGNERRSWDVNLYGTAMSIGDASEMLLPVFGALGQSRSAELLIESQQSADLGHISGGTARDGTPFVSVYYRDEALLR